MLKPTLLAAVRSRSAAGPDSHVLGDRQPGRILVHGHRGARAMRPENTIPAFEHAIAQGVDALEMDMAVTRDMLSSSPTTPSCTRQSAAAPTIARSFTA